MKKTSRVSRRSFVGLVTGVLAGVALAAPAKAQNGTSDSDPDDEAGHGRTGVTDADSGDRASYGRGGGRSGITDSDSGSDYC
mgnify:CR=1 FL=1